MLPVKPHGTEDSDIRYYTESIPIEGTYKDATHRKMSVLEVDFEANKKFLQENLMERETALRQRLLKIKIDLGEG